MVTYFVGGAIGSASTGLAYGLGGWTAVITLGGCYSGAALLVWLASMVRNSPGRHRRKSTLPAAAPP